MHVVLWQRHTLVFNQMCTDGDVDPGLLFADRRRPPPTGGVVLFGFLFFPTQFEYPGFLVFWLEGLGAGQGCPCLLRTSICLPNGCRDPSNPLQNAYPGGFLLSLTSM